MRNALSMLLVASALLAGARAAFLVHVLNAAIGEILGAASWEPYSYASILKRTFPHFSETFEPPLCSGAWPSLSKDDENVIDRLRTAGKLLFGTSSVTRPPKQYNCTLVSGSEYSGCIGFEAYIAQAICDRVAHHYELSSLSAHFYLTTWGSIVDDLMAHKYDAILSGMGSQGTWDTPEGPVNRTSILTFTCPYQRSDDAFVGIKENLPLTISDHLEDPQLLNVPGVSASVEAGTSMASWLETTMDKISIRYCGGAVPATQCRQWAIDADVNFYLAPILNAFYDDEFYGDQLDFLCRIRGAGALSIAIPLE